MGWWMGLSLRAARHQQLDVAVQVMDDLKASNIPIAPQTYNLLLTTAVKSDTNTHTHTHTHRGGKETVCCVYGMGCPAVRVCSCGDEGLSRAYVREMEEAGYTPDAALKAKVSAPRPKHTQCAGPLSL